MTPWRFLVEWVLPIGTGYLVGRNAERLARAWRARRPKAKPWVAIGDPMPRRRDRKP